VLSFETSYGHSTGAFRAPEFYVRTYNAQTSPHFTYVPLTALPTIFSHENFPLVSSMAVFAFEPYQKVDLICPAPLVANKHRGNAVRELEAFLHGVTREPPETFVAWRQELSLFDKYRIDDEALIGGWFRACRIASRERLRGEPIDSSFSAIRF